MVIGPLAMHPRREDDAKMGIPCVESYAARLTGIILFALDNDYLVHPRCVGHSDLHRNLTMSAPLCRAMNVKSKRFAPLEQNVGSHMECLRDADFRRSCFRPWNELS